MASPNRAVRDSGAGRRVSGWVAAAVLLFWSQCLGASASAPHSLKKPGYVVWSPSCKIPFVDPYDESIREFLKPVKPIVCSDRQPLTVVTSLAQGHVLRVDEAVEPQYVRRGQNVTCCYSSVSRPSSNDVPCAGQVDNTYNITSCKIFAKEVKLEPNEEFILVRCTYGNISKRYLNISEKKRTKVYVNMHGIVPIKPIVAEERRKRKSPDDDAWFNVLIVGYDAVSRLNLLRTMPKTVAYLKRVGYIDLQGFNKIGDNKFPNMMAFLTGMTTQQVMNGCWPSRKSKLDDCPFLWKDFQNYSYVSAYAEDTPDHVAFNFGTNEAGFLKQPTDYYFRPYLLAAKKKLKGKKRCGMSVCLGPISTTGHMFSYGLHFVKTFKNYFYFALFWLNNFSYNDLNIPRAMDARTLQFFEKLGDSGTYSNTIVVFLSDHGILSGAIRETHVGWFEERWPFVYIFLPNLFKKKYPEAYQNLQRNRNRLTSPFDLYVTLKDVLARGMNSTVPSGNVSLGCPKCKSLFSEDVGDRSCDDAGISPEWCTCTQYTYYSISVNDIVVKNAAKYALSQIQNKIKNSLESKGCAELLMHRVFKAKKKMGRKRHVHYYVVMFETLPGGGRFEATVKHFYGSTFSLLGMVSRLNAYGNDSFCVKDRLIKLYCFCLQ